MFYHWSICKIPWFFYSLTSNSWNDWTLGIGNSIAGSPRNVLRVPGSEDMLIRAVDYRYTYLVKLCKEYLVSKLFLFWSKERWHECTKRPRALQIDPQKESSFNIGEVWLVKWEVPRGNKPHSGYAKEKGRKWMTLGRFRGWIYWHRIQYRKTKTRWIAKGAGPVL